MSKKTGCDPCPHRRVVPGVGVDLCEITGPYRNVVQFYDGESHIVGKTRFQGIMMPASYLGVDFEECERFIRNTRGEETDAIREVRHSNPQFENNFADLKV